MVNHSILPNTLLNIALEKNTTMFTIVQADSYLIQLDTSELWIAEKKSVIACVG